MAGGCRDIAYASPDRFSIDTEGSRGDGCRRFFAGNEGEPHYDQNINAITRLLQAAGQRQTQ